MQAARSTCSIEPLTSQEAAEACARMMATSEPWLTIGRSYATCLQLVQSTTTETYVARGEQALLGFVIVNMNGPFRGYIQTLCVREGQRGTGIGRALIAWAEARIYRDSPNVFICVSSFNQRALSLYQRLGYQLVGELSDFLVRGHAELLLRKSLAPWAEFQPAGARQDETR